MYASMMHKLNKYFFLDTKFKFFLVLQSSIYLSIYCIYREDFYFVLSHLSIYQGGLLFCVELSIYEGGLLFCV